MDKLDSRPPEEAITDVPELVGLGEWSDWKVHGYSVGMRQRLGLAAALLREPWSPTFGGSAPRGNTRRASTWHTDAR
jgi:ABC-type Na+ transport system ATPase subunit NatA